MLIFTRLIVIAVLLLPLLSLGILSLAGVPVHTELLVVTVGTTAAAITLWAILSARYSRLYQLAFTINDALDHNQEKRDALVEPLEASPVRNDAIYTALHDLSERLTERRRQMRETFDKIGAILIALSQNRSLEVEASEFDVPDPDDRTLLLGTLCQLITSMQQTRQRSDVFANVLRESPIAMMITDNEYKIRSLNPAAEKLFGYTMPQLIHHSLMELFIEPPIKEHQAHLRKIVLNGNAALLALQQGKQEVFTTVSTGYGKIQLIGLRASFGNHCLFVIRERSKDKTGYDISGPETIHLEDATITIPMPAPLMAS